MTLQDIFNQLVLGGTVTLQTDKTGYTNLRTSLLRKYRGYSKLSSDVGIETYDSLFIKASYDDDSLTATFKLDHRDNSKRIRKSYDVAGL